MTIHAFRSFIKLLIIVPVGAVNAAPLTHVALLSFEDASGSIKTQLERTASNNCDNKLKEIRKAATSLAGIKRIADAKCVEVAEYIGYFERKSMALPYVASGQDSVLILRGASKRECNSQALLLRQSNNDSACIFPAKVSR